MSNINNILNNLNPSKEIIKKNPQYKLWDGKNYITISENKNKKLYKICSRKNVGNIVKLNNIKYVILSKGGKYNLTLEEYRARKIKEIKHNINKKVKIQIAQSKLKAKQEKEKEEVTKSKVVICENTKIKPVKESSRKKKKKEKPFIETIVPYDKNTDYSPQRKDPFENRYAYYNKSDV